VVVRRKTSGGAYLPVTRLLDGVQRINQSKEQIFIEGGDEWVYFLIPFSLNKEKRNDVNVVIYAPESIIVNIDDEIAVEENSKIAIF